MCIVGFSNCNIGAKDPPKADNAIARCCLRKHGKEGQPLLFAAAHQMQGENYTVGWLAASMILTNFSGTRDAPPIRPPSMSG